MNRVLRLGRHLHRLVADQPTLDLVTRLTLLLIVFSDWVVGDDWLFKAPLRIVALAGLLVPPLHRSRVLWLLLTLVMGCKTLDRWWTQDNHIFVLTYWCLALTLALFSGERAGRVAAVNARLLLGFSFAFASLWKGLLSADFMDGTYFHYTFLTDERFRDFALLFGGIDEATYGQNRGQLVKLVSPAIGVDAVQLASTSRLALLARLTTWWTIGIEGALALCFLWPGRRGPGVLRNAALLLFAWTTYLVASVETFGWTLLTLGVAQCGPTEQRARVLLVFSCGLVLLYDYVPLLALLRGG